MDLKEKVITEIKKIYDPEIPVNIYELGLIYDISINNKDVRFRITKLILTNIDQFNKRYDSFGDYLFTGVNYQGKLNKSGNSFIGLPKVNSDCFPYTILEIFSLIFS